MFSGLINFNELFTSYAKSKDPDFGVIYGVDYKIRENDGKVDTDGDGDIDTDDVRKKDIYGQTLDDGESYIQIGNYLSENMVLYDENTRKYTQVVGCYDKISAVIEFGAIPISSPVTCLSAELTALEFCNCNVLVPYNNQDKLWLRISGYWYPFKIIPNKPQIMIISKEESQDQVQVYIEEIIRENPAPSLETGLRTSCEGLTGSDCTAKKYCDLQCDSCLLSCSLFKRGRCDDTNYCKWTVDNKCECSGPPTCSDSDSDGYIAENVADVSTCGNVCGPSKSEACIGNNDCDDTNPDVGGGGGCENEYCTQNSDCASGLKCTDITIGRGEKVYECR